MRTIAVDELHERTLAVIEEVAASHQPCVLTRHQKPQAALVPYEDFFRFQQFAADRIHENFDRVQAELRERTAGFSDEEIAADVAEALAEVRA